MKKLTVFTAAVAAAMLTVASGSAMADRFDPQLGGRGLVVKKAAETEKAEAKPEQAVAKKAAPTKKAASRKVVSKKAVSKKPAVSKKAAKSTKVVKRSSRTASVAVETTGTTYSKIIDHYAVAYGVPVSLAHAVVKVESNYRPNVVGSAGEIGLMQIKPSTARMMGYSGTAKGLFNPDTNIKYGMKYLAKAHNLGGGTTCGTILKYNAGHAAKRMNPVSSAYCSKVKVHIASLAPSS